MNNSTLIAVIDNSVRMVNVEFIDNDTGAPISGARTYTYKCDDIDVKVGNIVVVESRKGYGVAQVTAVDVPYDLDTEWQYRWVLGIVYMSLHRIRKEREERLIEEVNKIRADSMREQILGKLGIGDRQALLDKIND